MTIKYMDVWLTDEVPKMGSGCRRLIIQIGRKLVTLYNCATGKRKVIPLNRWLAMRSTTILDDPKEILALLPKEGFSNLRRQLNETIKKKLQNISSK